MKAISRASHKQESCVLLHLLPNNPLHADGAPVPRSRSARRPAGERVAVGQSEECVNRNRQELESAIAAAQLHADALLYNALDVEGDARRALIEQHDAAEIKIGDLWRRLGVDFAAEVVVPLNLGFEPAPDVSAATLLQNEYGAFLLFDTSTRRGGPDQVAVVRFRSAASIKFGLPNDEALDGHPLRGRGLARYRCAEVLNSSWLAEEQRRNSVRFPGYILPCRHFIFTFHDSTLEILAQQVEAELRAFAERREIAAECLARLGDLSS